MGSRKPIRESGSETPKSPRIDLDLLDSSRENAGVRSRKSLERLAGWENKTPGVLGDARCDANPTLLVPSREGRWL